MSLGFKFAIGFLPKGKTIGDVTYANATGLVSFSLEHVVTDAEGIAKTELATEVELTPCDAEPLLGTVPSIKMQNASFLCSRLRGQ